METKNKEDISSSESTSPPKREPRGSFRKVLRNRLFVLIWLAQLISQIGFNAANYGLITLVEKITGSTVMEGIAIICFTLPAIPFSLLAGVYVDYLDKRAVMWISNALRAVASFLIVIALVLNPHTVVFLFILTFLISMITQFFMPAEASAIPLLVGKRELVPALSLFNITLTAAQAIGFLLLGRLIQSAFSRFTLSLGFARFEVTPSDMLFLVVAIGYVICTFLVLAIPRTRLLSLIHSDRKLPTSPGKEMWDIVQKDVKGGWSIISKDPRLLVSLIQVSVVSILLLVIGELAAPFVQRILHVGVDNLTILFAPAGVGLILGGALMPIMTRYLGKRWTIMLGSIITALSLILLPLSQVIANRVSFLHPWSLFIVGVLGFILGVSLDMINIPAQTVMQERAPEEERARVFSFQFMLYNAGSIPVLMFAGVIGDTLGIDTVMYLLGVSLLFFQWWVSHYGRKFESKALTEQKPSAESKAPTEQKSSAELKAPTEQKPSAESKAPTEQKPSAGQDTSVEQQAPNEEKSLTE